MDGRGSERVVSPLSGISVVKGLPTEAVMEVLLMAAETNDVHLLHQVAAGGYDVKRPQGERNPLCVAAMIGHVEFVQEILTLGCEVYHPDPTDKMWQRHAIHLASSGGHCEIVRALIDGGAGVNSTDGENRTPLHWAATSGWVDVAEYLIQEGASVNVVQKDGYTALHSATCLGHVSICRFLLSKGAEINRADRDGWTPLHAACCYGHAELVAIFLQSGSKVNQITRDEETPLHIVVDTGRLDIVNDLYRAGVHLEAANYNGYTAFFESVWRRKYSVCELLIDLGVNVNVRNNAGHSALYIATVRASPHFMKLVVAAGCDLKQERWVLQDRMPIALTEHQGLCEWLKSQVTSPQSLQTLAGHVIRHSLGNRKCRKVSSLPLPTRVKGFLCLEFLEKPDPDFVVAGVV